MKFLVSTVCTCEALLYCKPEVSLFRHSLCTASVLIFTKLGSLVVPLLIYVAQC